MAIVETPTIYVPQLVKDEIGESGYVYYGNAIGVANTTEKPAEEVLNKLKDIINRREELYERLTKIILPTLKDMYGFELKVDRIESEKTEKGVERKGFFFVVYDKEEKTGAAGGIACYVRDGKDDEDDFGGCAIKISCDVSKYGLDKCRAYTFNLAVLATEIEIMRTPWLKQLK